MMFTEKWPLLHSTWQGVLLLAPQLLQAQLLLRIQLWPSGLAASLSAWPAI